MSPYHGCLAVGTGGHLPGHMRLMPCQIRMRLISRPGWWVHHLAQGDLEAFVGGPIKGCLHEDGAIGQKLGENVFLLLVCRGDFCGRVIAYALQKTFCLHLKLEAEASIGPRPSTPETDILVSMLAGNPHHA